jgi:Core-2/I-Branching enzyme
LWFAINRKHAEIFANENVTEAAWETINCPDEHYLPTILAYNNLDNETTCQDGFAFAHWDTPTFSSHPRVFVPHETGEWFFREWFRRPANSSGQAGFNKLCSGNEDICHFTARKFSPGTKEILLENIHMILNDERYNIVYSGDQWAHINERLRITNDSKYFLLDFDQWRQIPDATTLRYMHLNDSLASAFTEADKSQYPFGAAYPSRTNGTALKTPHRSQIFIIQNGKKRGIPNMETFEALGLDLSNVHLAGEFDLEQIPTGPPVPNVKEHPEIRAQLSKGDF